MTTASVFLSGAKIYRNRSPIAKPAISIIMPTYCRGADGLLLRSIETIVSQSFQDFELLIVDDGSTDGSSEIISNFVRDDSRVIHVRHDMNSGLPALRVNEGLLLSRSEFIAYQFDDDQWSADALSILSEELTKFTELGLVYGKAEVKQGAQEWTIGGPFDFRKLTAGNFIANNSVLHRRKLFESFGGYDMHLVMRRLCDWDLWLRWSEQVPFRHIDAVVSYVEADLAGSLGQTAHYDIFASRVHMSTPRNDLLCPGSLSSYSVDGLEQFRVLGSSKVKSLWQFHIGPFQSRHRDIWPVSKPPNDAPFHVLVVIGAYDTNVDITISNFRTVLRGANSLLFLSLRWMPPP